MRRLVPLTALLLLIPATAQAKPRSCQRHAIKQAVRAAGDSVDAGFAQVICGDVTADGRRDGLFTVNSGGTAGATHFGVLTRGHLVLYEDGYKVSVDRVNDHRFDVQQPYYRRDDPNCCPSAFDVTPYRWTGAKFEAGHSKRHKRPQY
jgi:hypothetical protein